jgi:uncharacterized membrane protein
MAMAVKLKKYFFRGLAVLLPTILTIWLFIWGYNFIQNNISRYINEGIVRIMMIIHGIELSDKEAADKLAAFWVEGWGAAAGFVIALLLVVLAGFAFASVLGKALWRMIERFILNTPFLRRVYPYIKQITDFFLTRDEQEKYFSKVVAVEYPRKGIWSIGFVTGTGIKKTENGQTIEMLNVMMPTSPSPITGYVIVVEKQQTIPLDMTLEEAFRFIISAGVITPPFSIDEAKRGRT